MNKVKQLNVVLQEVNALKNDIESFSCVMADIDIQFVSKSLDSQRYPILTSKIFAESMLSKTINIISILQVYALERLGEMKAKSQEKH